MPDDIRSPQHTGQGPDAPLSESANESVAYRSYSSPQADPRTPVLEQGDGLSPRNNPGILVLQWLTYAFWGWYIVALTWLMIISVDYFVQSSGYTEAGSESTTVAYSLAAVIVLFIIAIICDLLYAKKEPLQKHGAAMVIMIIHAVIFALCGIGALIIAVFAVVRLMIGDSSSDAAGGTTTALITGLVIAGVYAVTLLRTLRPFKLKRVSLLFGSFMLIITAVVTALGIIGPALYASQTRDDRLIERGLAAVSDEVRQYTDENNKLPENLQMLAGELEGDAKTIVERNLVEYEPGEKVTTGNGMGGDDNQLQRYPLEKYPYIENPSASSYKYQLCVTYKGKKGLPNSMDMSYPESDIMPNTYTHDKGRVCYDLVTRMSYTGL